MKATYQERCLKKSNKKRSCIRYNMLKGWWQIVHDEIEYEKWFPQRLTQLRMRKGVSARDMSLSIGQNTGYINSIESGKNFPTMKNFFYICEYLHITPKEFFENGTADPEAIRKMVENLKKLDGEQVDALSKIVEGLAK
ncbi:helix-turn-helix transcriptional regulator [Faecalibacterium duncaniae]